MIQDCCHHASHNCNINLRKKGIFMLTTSLDLIVNAAINKAGLKEEPCHIHFPKEESSFPLVISFSTEENDYTLHIFHELVEELSSTVSYALYTKEKELLCQGKTEFYSSLNPFATKPYQHLIPERMSCDLCQKKLRGECGGTGEDLCRESF